MFKVHRITIPSPALNMTVLLANFWHLGLILTDLQRRHHWCWPQTDFPAGKEQRPCVCWPAVDRVLCKPLDCVTESVSFGWGPQCREIQCLGMSSWLIDVNWVYMVLCGIIVWKECESRRLLNYFNHLSPFPLLGGTFLHLLRKPGWMTSWASPETNWLDVWVLGKVWTTEWWSSFQHAIPCRIIEDHIFYGWFQRFI